MPIVKKQFNSIEDTQAWLKEVDTKPHNITVIFADEEETEPENATVRAIFKHIEETGGLSGHGEEILRLGRDFRDSFYFEKD